MGLVRGTDCPYDSRDTLRGGEVLRESALSFTYGFFREEGLVRVLVKALIISEQHYESVGDLPSATVADMWEHYLWLRITYGHEAPGRNFVINDDDGNCGVEIELGGRRIFVGVSGQTIAHPHVQYVPRWDGKPSSNAGLALLADKLDAALS